jgi:hypothetical protein
MSARRVLPFAAFAALLVAASSSSCASPTAIDVAIYSEVPCANRAEVALRVASDAPSLRTQLVSSTSITCEESGDGFVQRGSVVLVPVGDNGKTVAFEVLTRDDDQPLDACASNAARCISAKRQFRFSPGETVAVRIDLRLSCLGVQCALDQTCVRGRCVSATVEACNPCGEPVVPVGVRGCGDMTPYEANAPWPMSGYCPAQLWQSPFEGPATTPRLKWRQRLNKTPSTGAGGPRAVPPLGVPPTISADGSLFWGTVEGYDSNLAIVDRVNGSIRAERPTLALGCKCVSAGATAAPMLTAGGLVVVPGTYGVLFAHQKTAQGFVSPWTVSPYAPLRLWNSSNSDPVLADAKGNAIWGADVLRGENGTVLVDGADASNEQLLVPSNVALSDGIRYGIFRGTPWSIKAQTFPDLKPAPWGPVDLPGDRNPSLVVAPSGLVVAATNRGIFAYDVRDAKLRWSDTTRPSPSPSARAGRSTPPTETPSARTIPCRGRSSRVT